jgi:endonuclease/exonuclease/phosphatase family metal-dependent hydrolase
MRLPLRALGAPALVLAVAATALAGTGSAPGTDSVTTADTVPARVTKAESAVQLDSTDPVWFPRVPDITRKVGMSVPFRLASFNVLGDSHTAPGGNRKGWDDSIVRLEKAARLLDKRAIDLVGLQEFQRRQAEAFPALTDNAFAFFPTVGDRENAIAWRTSRFELLAATTQGIPYFNGGIRHMPVVLLRDNLSGQPFFALNVHNPARRGNQHWRDVAIRRERDLVDQLRTHGVPVFMTGDLNDRDRAFCPLTAAGDLRTPAGGSHRGGDCEPPRYGPVDWIFGSKGIGWANFWIDRSTQERRISDHPLIITDVTAG